jgi:phosphoglucosamine mutase
VGTLMTNLGMERALEKIKVPFARAPVGDRYVLELMQKRGWQLGGENSGHIICLDKHTTGDGIVSALQVLHAMRALQADLAHLTHELALYPQVLVNVKVAKGFDFKNQPPVQTALSEAEADLGDKGRVLLRASGTEPVVRVMVEGSPQAKVRQWADAIAQAVRDAAAE